MNTPKFFTGMAGILDLLAQIWNGFFNLQFFDAPFTFGDVLFALFFVGLGFAILRFFSNVNHSEGSNSKGVYYK